MKKISFFLAIALLAAPIALRAQDAAVEERLNKLSAQIEDLVAAKDAQNRKIEELLKAVESAQQQLNKPIASYASQEDLKNFGEKLQEIDRKRQDDSERVAKELDKLARTLRVTPAAPTRPQASTTTSTDAGTSTKSTDAGTSIKPEKGYEYTVKSGDSFSSIAKAYSDQGIKVTPKQIASANPNLKPESLKVGQKVFVPSPTQ